MLMHCRSVHSTKESLVERSRSETREFLATSCVIAMLKGQDTITASACIRSEAIKRDPDMSYEVPKSRCQAKFK